MSEQKTIEKPLIDQIYFQDEPNQPIDLGNVKVQFKVNGTEYRKNAAVRMRFLPKDDLQFIVPWENENPFEVFNLFMGSDRIIELELTEKGTKFNAFCVAAGGECNGIVLSPDRSCVTALKSTVPLAQVVFHLFNFPDFWGPENCVLTTGNPPLQGAKTYGTITLESDGWIITIADTDCTSERDKKLKSQGGYVITHMGKVVRKDGSTFYSEQVEELLGCLHYYLSFVLGRWAGVALPVGFDGSGNRVYEQWGMGRVADGHWKGSCSWFDDRHGELVSQVFPGFNVLWNNSLWHEPLTHALYWYLGASDRGVGIGVDTGLILAQTALELLAWTYCVRDQKMVSEDAFKRHGLSAADKIRLLLSTLRIPKDIPKTLAGLQAMQGKQRDGMDVVTSIRNSLVHPKTQPSSPAQPYYEAYELALWYIEMILLRLCGHNGQYANRLSQNRWAGTVEPVPWT